MFLIEKKHPIETDIIIEILKSERIPFKLRAIRQESYFAPSKILGYNIEIYSDLEHFDFAKKLIIERMNNINKNEAIFNSPSIAHPLDAPKEEIKEETLIINGHLVRDVPKALAIGELTVEEYKPKKSLLKRIIEWINDHV